MTTKRRSFLYTVEDMHSITGAILAAYAVWNHLATNGSAQKHDAFTALDIEPCEYWCAFCEYDAHHTPVPPCDRCPASGLWVAGAGYCGSCGSPYHDWLHATNAEERRTAALRVIEVIRSAAERHGVDLSGTT